MSGPLDDIQEGIEVLQGSDRPGARRLGEAFATWLSSGAKEPIGKALKLQTRGGISPARAIANAERNRLARALWQGQPEWRELSPTAAAGAMTLAFTRYEATRWAREQDAVSAPPHEPAATFWRLLRADQPLPGSTQLARVLAGED